MVDETTNPTSEGEAIMERGEHRGVIPANLGDLHDVASTPPTIGDTLIWDGENWAPGAGAGGGGTSGLPPIGPAPSGAVLQITQDPPGENASFIIRPYVGPAGANPPSSGSWTITFDGETTVPMNVLVGDVQPALDALPSIGAGNTVAEGAFGGIMGGGQVTVTFTGDLGSQAIAAERLTVDGTNLVGDDAPYSTSIEQVALGATGGEKAIAWVVSSE